MVPALEVAPKTTVPLPQELPGVVEVMVGMLFTVIVTEFEVAVLTVAQGSLEVITQLTTSPLANELFE